jgi:hypothetical protein
MGAFNKISGGVAAVTVAGAMLMAAPVAAQAQSMAGGLGAIGVPCDATALATAISDANSAGGGVLSLASDCTYAITAPATAADGLPIITGRVTITGGSNTIIERDVVPLFRIMEVAAGGDLILNHVIVEDGSTAGLGGGVLNGGTLTVTSSTFTANTGSNGGAISNSAGATASIANSGLKANTTTSVGGGAIINFGTLNVSGTSIAKNHAPINGGGVNTQPSGVTHISSSSFVNNTSGGLGGGLANLGTTVLTGTEVRLNTGSSGGGIATGNSNVTLHASIVQDNIPNNCNPLNTIPGCVD